jgi:hypothetical protein
MDVFEVHRRLVRDYRSYTEGFAEIADARLHEHVRAQLDSGTQWPDPWLSLNPSFESAGTVEDLVTSGLLHGECARIFQRGKDVGDAQPLTLHRHQQQAISAAASGASYVLTTGTGSGKSLAYIVPIVDRVLRRPRTRGVKAIVVYPMNALANSQREELGKFLTAGYGAGSEPVTFARYTGQEDDAARQAILADPPDILLTNYVMLELVLTRPEERRRLIEAATDLQFLVLDELHTYRGRQGADVAMLVRRVRAACRAEHLQCVGTSATIASRGTPAEQAAAVAEVASRIFGTDVAPEHVIGETLVAGTEPEDDPAALGAAVDARGDVEVEDPALAAGFDAVRRDPLAGWAEREFGLQREGGLLRRKPPTSVERAARTLAETTGRDEAACRTALRATLLAGSRSTDQRSRPLFAFRLHQFLSKGDGVFVTLEPPAARTITSDYQPTDPQDPHKPLFSVAFCRECGQDYLCADRVDDGGLVRFIPRHDLKPVDKGSYGYLYVGGDDAEWPQDPVVANRLPASWVTDDGRLVSARKDDVPKRVQVTPAGDVAAGGTTAAWVPGIFRFCLACGVSYETTRGNEFVKLVTLNLEGRSSAMTVVGGSIVRSLRDVDDSGLPADARKLLTFVDNRQDASLQAGHFNDFALVSQLRAAVHRAARETVERGEPGLPYEEIGRRVTAALQLDGKDYLATPGQQVGLDRAQRALRRVVEYRTLLDLRKGWRITLPDLEQTGLLHVRYADLSALAGHDGAWSATAPALRDAAPGVREEVARVLLDECRRVLAVDAEPLSSEAVEELKRLSAQVLSEAWALPEGEPDPNVGLVVAGPGRVGGARNVRNLTWRGAYGRWLRRPERWPHLTTPLAADDVGLLVAQLLDVLAAHGLLSRIEARGDTGYRINAAQLLLVPGDGSAGALDPPRRRFDADSAPRVVPFFRDLYRDSARGLAGLFAREHTAQVPMDKRLDRERDFRAGTLKLLFCSPTMELGVDIASLNAVGMRNVPPTPANYAQRSGRAGRSGQPALVATYCASGNAHDQYWFRRSRDMVSGVVSPPRLDLANEDLVRSHVQAVWLAEAGVALGRSLEQVVDTGADGFPLHGELRDAFADPDLPARAWRALQPVLADPRLHADLRAAPWWRDGWVEQTVAAAGVQFDRACDRWRELYRQVLAERAAAEARIDQRGTTKPERDRAREQWRDAERRRELLLNSDDGGGRGGGDFYTYRYLASEGFLPGYSFPRLPLAAYVPGRQGRAGDYVQRPRFLAVTEFGPGALVYHEGGRYEVTRVQLPRKEGSDRGEIATFEVRVCEACGYHHDRELGAELCQACGTRLAGSWKSLMRMQTVSTRRRERISADEEERNRVGFELRTTYRFADAAGRPAVLDAGVLDAAGHEVAALRYGDSVQLRIVNLGRARRKNPAERGFWIDPHAGTWLTEKRASDAQEWSDSDAPAAEDVKHKQKVVPFVEDTRNALVWRWSAPLDDVAATTLRFALERGIETSYELEDGELASEALPDDDARGRTLFVESAEGGAGVLRRLQAEPDALAAVARRALELLHVDPDTLDDVDRSDDRPACQKGCYDCLLSYGNQQLHRSIDRRTAVPLLAALAGGRTEPQHPAELTPPAGGADDGAQLGERARRLLALLEQERRRRPQAVGLRVDGVDRPIDLVFSVAGATMAVLVDEHGAAVPDAVEDALWERDWSVVRVGLDDELADVVAANPSAFGHPGEVR